MEYAPEIRYFVQQWIRRGMATYSDVRDVSQRYAAECVDSLVEELNVAGVRLVDNGEVAITAETNVLMNDLRLLELVHLALRLPVAPKVPRTAYRTVIQQRSYELDLKRLEYLDSDDDWYYLAPSFSRLQRAIRQLFNSGQIPFAKDWRSEGRKESLGYLKGLVSHPLFVETILPLMREHYLRLRGVRLLVSWIEVTDNGAPALVDIVDAGLLVDGPRMVRGLLLSEQASTADSALRNRRDVCFQCPTERRCLPLQDANDPYLTLMQYRYSDLDTLLKTRYPDRPLDECLLADRLVVKFFVPYSVVVTSKRFMVETRCLESSAPILRKDAGRYCPKADRWRMKSAVFTRGGE